MPKRPTNRDLIKIMDRLVGWTTEKPPKSLEGEEAVGWNHARAAVGEILDGFIFKEGT